MRDFINYSYRMLVRYEPIAPDFTTTLESESAEDIAAARDIGVPFAVYVNAMHMLAVAQKKTLPLYAEITKYQKELARASAFDQVQKARLAEMLRFGLKERSVDDPRLT